VTEESQTAEKEQSQAQGNLASAADRLRDSAKWLIASFGAAAAVVVAGISLSDIGKLSTDTPGHRLAIAVIGTFAGVLGVLGALATAMSLAAASIVTIDDLGKKPRPWKSSLRAARRTVLKDPALRPWHGKFSDFVGDIEKARNRYQQELRLYMQQTKLTANPALLKRAAFQVEVLEAILARLLDTASFLRLQDSFARARFVIAAWLLLAATGVLAFVYAVQADEGALDVPAAPVSASLALPTADRVEVAKRLGTACSYDLGAVPVVVLAIDDSTAKAQVITVPSAGCTPVRLEVAKDTVTAPPPKVGG
jgi:hypothetical protein